MIVKTNLKKFPESKLAHKYLDGLFGLEIGGSAHNPFGLNTKNVDFTANKTVFKQEEIEKIGEVLPVDIVASGENIPVGDESQDFVVSSHVLEHFPDPIKALREWYRIIRPGGYIFVILPHKDRTFDVEQKDTLAEELLERHSSGKYPEPFSRSGHYSFWTTDTFLDLILKINLEWKIVDFQNIDDKVGNGFSVVIRKIKADKENLQKIKSDIEFLKKEKAKERAMSFPRGRRMIRNAMREFRRNGVGGILLRIKDMNKWLGE